MVDLKIAATNSSRVKLIRITHYLSRIEHIAPLPPLHSDARSSKIRLLYSSEDLKIAIQQMWNNKSLHDACIQKFVKMPDSNHPVFVRTVWKKDSKAKTKDCSGFVLRSNFPYLANITSHLDPSCKDTSRTSSIRRLRESDEENWSILEQVSRAKRSSFIIQITNV